MITNQGVTRVMLRTSWLASKNTCCITKHALRSTKNLCGSSSYLMAANISTSLTQEENDFGMLLRKSARQIFDAGVQSVVPGNMVRDVLHLKGKTLTVNQQQYHVDHNVHIVAFGKAVTGMVRAVEDVLGENVAGGIASIPSGIKDMLKDRDCRNLLPSFESKVKLMEGALNNIPDAQSLAAATEIAALAESLTEKDIMLVLISGGGSALLPAPAPPVSLEDKLHTINLLASRGATIKQLNTVRKNLSTLKGGRLAKLAYPAQVISLILSDIIGDPIDLIASGPTAPDHSSPGDCLKILQDFGLGVEQLPPSIFQCLSIQDSTTALMSQAALTHLSHVNNFIIGSNAIAVASAINCAKDLGYSALNFSCAVDGEAKDVAKMYVALATAISEVYHSCKSQLTDKKEHFCHTWQSLQVAFNPFRDKVQDVEDTVKAAVRDNKPVCIIGAGETVVTITGSGKGGRNQELALAAHIVMETSLPLQKFHHLGYRVGLLSAGTDGQDGPTNAAGALAVLNSSTAMRQFGLDSESFLRNNDSYTFYKTWNDGKDLLITGLTGTNVMDLHILLVHPPES